jgi:4Fe-4S ferredoxin
VTAPADSGGGAEVAFTVTVDARRCEGAAACVKACPVRVFRMEKPTNDLPLITRMKVAIHGGCQAAVADEAACVGCLRCVAACPKRAISVGARATPLKPVALRRSGQARAHR